MMRRCLKPIIRITSNGFMDMKNQVVAMPNSLLNFEFECAKDFVDRHNRELADKIIRCYFEANAMASKAATWCK